MCGSMDSHRLRRHFEDVGKNGWGATKLAEGDSDVANKSKSFMLQERLKDGASATKLAVMMVKKALKSQISTC